MNDKAEIETTNTSLTIRRVFDVQRERLYRAFTDSDELEQWYAPGDLRMKVHTLEPEPGGTLSFSFIDGEHQTTIEGTYVKVIKNERIVHTWQYPDEEESRVTYEFHDTDQGTVVTLVHEQIGPDSDRSSRENVDGYVEGWSRALETLAEAVVRR